MPEIFIRLIEAAAWPMAAPKPYSPFHLLLTAAGLAAALLSAIALGKSFRKKPRKELEKSSRRLLFACGLVLMFMEAYKQCFLFYLNGFHYNWWYFPFQLCSVPMYLCLSFPRIKTAERRTVLASFLCPGVSARPHVSLLDADAPQLYLAFPAVFYRNLLRGLRSVRPEQFRLAKGASPLFCLLRRRPCDQYSRRARGQRRYVLYFSLPSVGAARFPPDRRSPGNPSRNPYLSGRGPCRKQPDS